MTVTRRNFLRTSGAVAVSATLMGSAGSVLGQRSPDGLLFPIPVESTSDSLTYLSSEFFEPFVNSYMTAESSHSRPVQVLLTEVRKLSLPENKRNGITGESFSLLFKASKRGALTSDTYTFNHISLGTFSLLLTPVKIEGDEYEAIINRIEK